MGAKNYLPHFLDPSSGLALFLAANVTRNMIGAAANNSMHVIGSQ